MKKGIIIVVIGMIITFNEYFVRLNVVKKANNIENKEIVGIPREKIVVKENRYKTRVTSYWVNDECNSIDMTASGKSSKDFKLNDKGWYTWNGMLVVATASKRLGNTNQKTYKLYDQITLVINGISYKAVVLDVCGACMRDNRIDLFVKNRASMVDGTIDVIR